MPKKAILNLSEKIVLEKMIGLENVFNLRLISPRAIKRK
jgi:hypothetical protein